MNVLFIRTFLAEKEGFEPSIPFWGIHDFQSCALGQLRDFSMSDSPCGQLGYITAFFFVCQALNAKNTILSHFDEKSRPARVCSCKSFSKGKQGLCVQLIIFAQETCKLLRNLLCAAGCVAFNIQRQKGIVEGKTEQEPAVSVFIV